jgi:mono/diheme cytochrome c family protein
VPLALTGYQIGLLATASVFVAFAFIVALVVPRSRPDFPGKGLPIFLAVAVVLFAAQMTAVLLLAEVGEADEPAAAEETQPTETTTTETTTTETETTGPTETQGDPVAGKAVFTGSAGCTGCHTLADANATGTVGPNLDTAKPPYDLVVERVTNGKGVMPPFGGTLSEQQIRDVAAYISSVAGS